MRLPKTVRLLTGATALFLAGAFAQADLLWPASSQRYTRVPGWYTVARGGTCEDVAARLVPQATAQEVWLVGQEIAAINGVRAAYDFDQGYRLRVPIYRPYRGPRSRYATVDLRTWHVCVMAALRYGVRPSLLVGIRLHEGGNQLYPSTYFGCKPYGSYGLREEAVMAARIVRRHADRQGWDAWQPTRGALDRLGGYYTTGRWGASNAHWGGCVSAIMQRAEGRDRGE